MRRLTTRFLFVRGCLLIAVLIAPGAACATDPTTGPQPRTPSVAEPETVGKMADDVGEDTTPDGGLECTGGMAVGGTSDYAPGAEGKGANPVEQTRRAFSGQIREGDGVGLSTTPQRGDQRTVRGCAGGGPWRSSSTSAPGTAG